MIFVGEVKLVDLGLERLEYFAVTRHVSGQYQHHHSLHTTTYSQLFQSVDDKLFEKIVCNSVHVIQPLIPDRPPSSYDLRLRSHDKLLLNKTSYLNDHEFIIRMLYKDSY